MKICAMRHEKISSVNRVTYLFYAETQFECDGQHGEDGDPHAGPAPESECQKVDAVFNAQLHMYITLNKCVL